jgi:F0F1-type ATP synthase membrane subunit b/b'
MSNPTPENKPVTDALREWGFDVKTFEARAKKSLDTARGDLTEINGALRQTLTQAKEVLVNLQKQRRPVAEELKKGFEDAWDAIEKAFTRAREKVREQDRPAPPP